jgi:pyridoxamine 5'-phosphate oxidase family protein
MVTGAAKSTTGEDLVEADLRHHWFQLFLGCARKLATRCVIPSASEESFPSYGVRFVGSWAMHMEDPLRGLRSARAEWGLNDVAIRGVDAGTVSWGTADYDVLPMYEDTRTPVRWRKQVEPSPLNSVAGGNMSQFSEREIHALKSASMGRIATVGRDGQPHVVPVDYRFDAETNTIEIGGYDFEQTKKYRDIAREPRVAIVVDDVPPGDPDGYWGIEIRGRAETLASGGSRLGNGFAEAWIRIHPERIISWGIDE